MSLALRIRDLADSDDPVALLEARRVHDSLMARKAEFRRQELWRQRVDRSRQRTFKAIVRWEETGLEEDERKAIRAIHRYREIYQQHGWRNRKTPKPCPIITDSDHLYMVVSDVATRHRTHEEGATWERIVVVSWAYGEDGFETLP